MTFRKLLQVVERRGPGAPGDSGAARRRGPRQDVLGRSRAPSTRWPGTWRSRRVTATVVEDAEHQAFAVLLEDRSAGYGRRHRLDLGFRHDRRVPHAGVGVPGRARPADGPVTIRTTARDAGTGRRRRAEDRRRRRAARRGSRPEAPPAAAVASRAAREDRPAASSRSTSSWSTSSPPAGAACRSIATRASAR